MLPLALFVCVLVVMAPAAAFLPTTLNFTDPALQPILCPDNITAPTHDHKAITREAVRREVRRYFLEHSPSNDTFTIPEDASLSQIFKAYYGPTSSPARFMKAVNSIAWSNAMTEMSGQQRFHTAYHMDGENIHEGHMLLQGRYHQLISTVTTDQDYDFARELLGNSLNGIQDFYSQTTWVELGHVTVLKGLGLPGFDIGEVAGPDDPTCTNCDDVVGSCQDNVIPSGRLSSGYYEYSTVGADDYIMPKPGGAGKCSHGGSLDSSVMMEARGGINKETSSPCFSPHHYLHQQAVDLAITASEHYIATVRDAIGDQHFVGLLALYQGSALSIVIDITHSMMQELVAVKEEAKLIVNHTDPELYVFVPFGDPDYGPITKTTDEDEFLQVLDAVKLQDACCCLEEKFWHGLQLALINTPDYSSIFCFTDAGANDAELMEGVMALAAAKQCRVSIIYSYDNVKKLDEGGNEQNCPGYTVSGIDEYRQLAELSGGQFIEIDKFNINEVIGIMENGVEQSQVIIRARDDVIGLQDFSFPIDDTVIEFQIILSGVIPQATLTDMWGAWYNLIDQEQLNTTGKVEIISYTSTLKVVTFTSPTIGEWALEVKSDKQYSLAVTATSTLDLLTELAVVDIHPPRPGYVLTQSRPLAGETYYVEVILVGYLESGVLEVTSMDFVNKNGSVLSHMEYSGPVDDHMYILSEPLPPFRFYIQVDGFLETGSPFSRIYPTMAIPVECVIDLVEEDSALVAAPGQTTRAYFTVFNYGPETQFQYTATDEEAFIFTWFPKISTIPSMGSEIIEVDFRVSSLVVPGTTSTVTFTAASLASKYNTNTFITHYLVVGTTEDNEPPTCMSPDVPNCSGHNSEDTCFSASWSVTATLHDSLSGLDRVFSRPSDGFSVEDFPDATTNPVIASFTSSCCIRELEIIGVDKRGNVGRCQWNLDSLQGSTTAECVTSATPQLTTTSFFTTTPQTTATPFITTSLETTMTSFITTTLETTTTSFITTHPETTIAFITSTTESSTAPYITTTVKATTTPKPSGWVVDFVAESVGETWVGLKWTVSDLRDDFFKFSVLINNDYTDESRCPGLVCRLNVTYLEPCTTHTFELRAHFRTPDGVETEDDPLILEAATLGTIPEPPTNPSIDYVTETSTMISWDPPSNIACLSYYQVCYTMAGVVGTDCKNSSSNSLTLDGLVACTLYHITVASISSSGLESQHLKFDTNTDDAAPGAPENLVVSNKTSHWVELSWDNPLDRASCVDKWMISMSESMTFDVTDAGTVADNIATLSPLVACTNYTFWVSGVSPGGSQGSTRSTETNMEEVEPTAVTSVSASALDASRVWAGWVPAETEECVDHYLVCITNIIDISQDCIDTNKLEDTFSGLEACVDYDVSVRSVSPSGDMGTIVFDKATTADLATSPPTDLLVVQVTAHTVDVSFGPPLEHPLCVVEYDILVQKLTDVAQLKTVVTPYLEETISGLEACINYKLGVSAVTTSGFTSDMVSVNFTTEEDTPSAPRALSQLDVSTTTITLQWYVPLDNPMCADVYRLVRSSIDSGCSTTDIPVPDHPPLVMVDVDSLSACTSYTFAVSALTPLGNESPSITIDVSTVCS